MAAKKTKPAQTQAPTPPFLRPFRAAQLPRAVATAFDLTPTADELPGIERFLGLQSLSGLRFKGTLIGVGETDWRAEGRLTATTTQGCVITLAPVVQSVDEQVRRGYTPLTTGEDGAEIDLDPDADDDDDPDGFTDEIDLGQLALETLALALDPYPRAKDAVLDRHLFAPPGTEPLSDEAIKPFAKLAELKEKLSGTKP